MIIFSVLRCGDPMAGNPSITQARHRQHLTECGQLLRNFISKSLSKIATIFVSKLASIFVSKLASILLYTSQ